MDPARFILGPVLTEKAERLKSQRTYTLRVSPAATKTEIVHALESRFDVDIESVRALSVRPKRREARTGRWRTKRHAWKKVLVTLTPKSKTLDLSSFRTS